MNAKIVRNDLKKLDHFVKFFGDESIVKVGIMGKKNARQGRGPSNADIGAVHEFGSFTRRIPMRSFLRMPLFAKTSQILSDVVSAGFLKKLAEGRKKDILKDLGIACEGVIADAFASKGFGSWLPIKHATAKRKHSTAVLIETGQLRRSISSEVASR